MRIGTQEKYIVYPSVEELKYIHFSIDDTIEIFKDLTEKKYSSIFQNDTLKFLKEIHDLYGARFTFYCFYEYNSYCLKDASDRYREEFEGNSDWLKFGFHALNSTVNYEEVSTEQIKKDYELVIGELKRIVGEKSLASYIRLEKFICNEENVKQLKREGVVGLLGSDTQDRKNYFLNNEQNEQLNKNGNLYQILQFLKTDIRLERMNIKDVQKDLQEDREVIAFTHEWILYKPEVRKNLEELCKIAVENHFVFEYPEKIRGIYEKDTINY